MTKAMIEVKDLTKKYKSNIAVNKVDFNVTRGEIFGLIGQNGAGKSTLLKMIGGMIYPSSGEIHFFEQGDEEGEPYFERMGLLIEKPGLYPHYSAYKNLELLALYYGMKKPKQYINDLLNLVGLDASNKTKVKNYSMGMQQRLGIAAALFGSPDVLILDEPINGLDPSGIAEIRKLILELNKEGLTIVLSSHILEELSKVADKYAIIHKGEIMEVISKEDLLLQCEERIEVVIDNSEEVIPVLEQQLNMTNYKVLDQQSIHIYDEKADSQQVVKVLADNGLFVHSILKHKMSLEQYFLERTGSAGESDD